MGSSVVRSGGAEMGGVERGNAKLWSALVTSEAGEGWMLRIVRRE